ncbi:MAG: sulfotransferase [Alphaproteobacteria bacterium]
MLNTDTMIFLLGAPRSGTTWIGKIFDSHPQVLYRHEPDIKLNKSIIPYTCNDIEKYKAEAVLYTEDLAYGDDIRSIGKPPIFDKEYRNYLFSTVRKSGIYLLRYGASVIPALNAVGIPDLISAGQPRIVIKSVGALGRAGVFSAARPASHFIHILRHPCGHVGSVLRGNRMNKFSSTIPLGFEAAEIASQYDISRAKLEAMTMLEQVAWRWVILNHKAMLDLQGNPNAMTLVYEDLCAAPIDVSRRLFAFTGLDWNASSEAFLTSKKHSGEGNSYHSVFRDPFISANKWREELKPEEIDAITAIVANTVPGKLFYP